MICESMKRTDTKRPFLFAVIGVAIVALLTTASYTYITLCNDQPKRPNNARECFSSEGVVTINGLKLQNLGLFRFMFGTDDL